MRPVMHNKLRYESLRTPGLISLDDISRLNHALDVEAENNYRLHNSKPRKYRRIWLAILTSCGSTL